MLKFLIIADDFTGALDTAVKFANVGLSTRVDRVFDSKANWTDLQLDVLAICVPTRHRSAPEAYERVHEVVIKAVKEKVGCVFKKTDSILRGNVGSELEAVLDASGRKVLHFIPALPKMNRVTSGGRHLIGGIPISETVFGRDPFDPVKESYIPDLLSIKTKDIRSIPVGQLPDPIVEHDTIFVYDCTTDQEMETLVRKLKNQDQLKFIAGCSGLAEAVAANEVESSKGQKSLIFQKKVKPKPLIVISGSLHHVSKEQIRYAKLNGFYGIQLSMDAMMSERPFEQNCGMLGEWFQELEYGQKDLIFEAESTDKLEISPSEDPSVKKQRRETVSRHLGKLAKLVMETCPDSNVVVIGGDTLLAVLESIAVKTVYPIYEIRPGVVLSEVVFNNQTVQLISKSGGFGNQELLVHLREEL